MAGFMVPLGRRMNLERRCSSSVQQIGPLGLQLRRHRPSISRVTTMDCSLAQMVPLSKVLESRIRLTARRTSAAVVDIGRPVARAHADGGSAGGVGRL